MELRAVIIDIAFVLMVLVVSTMHGRHVYPRDQLIDLRPTLRYCTLPADVTEKCTGYTYDDVCEELALAVKWDWAYGSHGLYLC